MLSVFLIVCFSSHSAFWKNLNSVSRNTVIAQCLLSIILCFVPLGPCKKKKNLILVVHKEVKGGPML